MSIDCGVNNILNTIILDDPVNPVKTKKVKKSRPKLEIFNYDEYINNNIILKSYTIPILKQVCKKYKLHVSGTKPKLIERIDNCFKKIKNSIIIQKNIRKYFVKKVITQKNEFESNRDKCTNITDFSTLEPIKDVSFEYFYCYTDIDSFTYGFDITSIIEMLRKSKKIFNPYTRSPITKRHKKEIINIYNLSILIFPSFKETNKPYNMTDSRLLRANVRNQYRNLMNRLTNEIVPNTNVVSSYSNYNPTLYANTNQMSSENSEQYQRIVNMREQPLTDRITALFMEIDQLGNYTNSSWFNNLSHIQYAQLYRCFYDIWNYRGQLSQQVKIDICPFHSPFDGIFPHTVWHIDLSTTTMKTACLIVFENLVYSGTNIEFRKIGTLLALTGITLISQAAREALPWLYESIVI